MAHSTDCAVAKGAVPARASTGQPQLLCVVGLWALTAAIINLSIGGRGYALLVVMALYGIARWRRA